MKKTIVLVAAFCLAFVGFSQKVMAGPMPLSVQESNQLSALASNDGLLTLKAGGACPNMPVPLMATEESSLRNLSARSENLETLKAGDDVGGIGLISLLVIVLLVVLILRVA